MKFRINPLTLPQEVSTYRYLLELKKHLEQEKSRNPDAEVWVVAHDMFLDYTNGAIRHTEKRLHISKYTREGILGTGRALKQLLRDLEETITWSFSKDFKNFLSNLKDAWDPEEETDV